MLKQMVLLKRRPGMSMADFIQYYETRHAKLVENYLPYAKRYFRRYVQPEINPITGVVEELDVDVVLEIWWESRADFEANMAHISKGEAHRLIYEDEENLFDSHKHRSFTVAEHETDMEAVHRRAKG